MKKIGVFVLAFMFIFLAIVSAQNATEDKAYACLENKTKDKCSTLTLEEQSFSLLALSYNSEIQKECKSEILKNSNDKECWPKSACKVKNTALAVLALDSIGEDTDKAETWLLKNNRTATELEWYLEIESNQATSCTITSGSASSNINIAEDKKISGSLGTCFSLAYDNYWLKISNNCLNKKLTVSCNKDFLSTLLYKKPQGNVWFVSSDVKQASSGGKTEHEINYICFGATSGATSCEYEASLWAVLALKQTENEISMFMPYLTAFAEDNQKFFPYSFLYYLTNSEEYLQQIITSQKTQGYWDFGEKGKFYDTALALLVLSESEAETNAKSWLGENQDKTGANTGCWNSGSKRDTAFLLWAGWPKSAVTISGGVETPGVETPNCEPTYGYCLSQGECDEVGNVLRNYYCSGLKVCCDKQAKEKTCSDKGGKICPSGQECDISETTASDTQKCCLGNCVSEKPECEDNNYNCRASCLSEEEEATYDCPTGKKCCKPKLEEGKSYWWLWLLIILIILVILGIIFRSRLRVLIFKLKGGFKAGEVTKTRPGFPPAFPPAYPPTLRRMPMPQRPLAKTATKTDKELEETLKKLKEMSK